MVGQIHAVAWAFDGERIALGRARPDPKVPPTRRTKSKMKKSSQITPRELEIVKMLLEGATNRQIADRCTISDQTAKFHVNNLIAHFKVTNRVQVVVAALRAGVLTL